MFPTQKKKVARLILTGWGGFGFGGSSGWNEKFAPVAVQSMVGVYIEGRDRCFRDGR